MAQVEIAESLKEGIYKKFKSESIKIFDLMYSLKDNPRKGKHITHVANIAIKELKYKSFRFYFIANNYQIRFLDSENLKDLLIKFVRMSNKKSQQKTIDEIKNILRKFGQDGF